VQRIDFAEGVPSPKATAPFSAVTCWASSANACRRVRVCRSERESSCTHGRREAVGKMTPWSPQYVVTAAIGHHGLPRSDTLAALVPPRPWPAEGCNHFLAVHTKALGRWRVLGLFLELVLLRQVSQANPRRFRRDAEVRRHLGRRVQVVPQDLFQRHGELGAEEVRLPL
jgi:hypothetical protein